MDNSGEVQGHYLATINHREQPQHAIRAAKEVVGEERVIEASSDGSEDFAYMLQERPSAYIFMGSGDGVADCIITSTTSTTVVR
ncbi:M20/M25/M40 family metallo-hydrolase [Bradyrhizobium niftali]|uniref:M20/M25/M40 family metallo-hydrolase n=1 Tax=Bradyrhizobium niftali TaxID=2560055 RepID=UPI00384DE3D7